MKHNYKYDTIRIFLTFLVIVGHSNYYSVFNNYGSFDISSIMANYNVADTNSHYLIEQIKQIIYLFHMPAFITLSGALFIKQIELGRFSKIQDLIKNKFLNLIVPLLIVYFLWNTPIKILSGFYTNSNNIVTAILLQIIFPKNMYLWFLECLFWDFILAYIVLKTIKNKHLQFLIFAVLFILGVLIDKKCDLILFGNPLKYVIWFYFGFFIEKIIKLFESKISRECLGIFILCFFSVIYILFLNFKLSKFLVKDLILPFLGILFVWVLAECFTSRLNDTFKFKIKKFAGYTFGIYLYSEPLNFLILKYALTVFGISAFGNEFFSFSLIMFRIFFTLIVSLVITLVLKRIKLPIVVC